MKRVVISLGRRRLFGPWSMLCLRLFVLGLLSVGELAAEPSWQELMPSRLKVAVPVSLPRNPLQQSRPQTPSRSAQSKPRREAVRRLRRMLDEQIRGVVNVGGRSLLLFGGRVFQVGQELPMPKEPGAESGLMCIRIKALESGRLVLLLSEAGAEEDSFEEWVYAMSEFLVQK